ncbi:hypothetical protein D9M71_791760 [compost metagenome]
MIVGLQIVGGLEDRLFNAAQVSAHQLNGGCLIAGFKELDQAQVFVAAAGFMAFVIEG